MPHSWFPSNGVSRRLFNAAIAAILAFTTLVIIPGSVPAVHGQTADVGGTCGVDVLFILDESGSMNGAGVTAVRSGVTSFVDTLGANPNTDGSRVGIVRFGNTASKPQGNSWSSVTGPDATAVKTWVNNTFDASPAEWTNWQAAFDNAVSFTNANSDKPDYVVFITDGNPTVNNATQPNGSNGNEDAYRDDALPSANALKGLIAGSDTIIGFGAGSAFTAPGDTFDRLASVVDDPTTINPISALAAHIAALADELCTPKLAIDKTGSTSSISAPGTVNYGFVISNPGLTTLSGVTLTDAMLNNETCDWSNSTDAQTGDGLLSAGESVPCSGSYAATQGDIDAGTALVNTAFADSNQTDPVDDTWTVTIEQGPEIDLVKSGVLDKGGDGVATPGDIITYTFTVENTGNTTLTGITVEDGVSGVIVTGTEIASLAPGASDNTSYSGAYAITQDDIDAGSFDNVAEACDDDEVCDDDDETVDLSAPSLTLSKLGDFVDESDDGLAQVGETITYSFIVTNNGNVTLYDVDVADLVGGITVTGDPIDLAPDESNAGNFTASYVITQDDIDNGHFYNKALACGFDGELQENALEGDVCDDDDHDEDLPQDPSIDVVKTVDKAGIEVKDTIEFSITVTNDGNVTLYAVTLDDVMDWQKSSGYTDGSIDLDACEALFTDAGLTLAYGGDKLAVGDSLYAGCSVDLDYGDHGDGVRNTAEATAYEGLDEDEVTDSDDALVAIDRPALGLAISKEAGPLGSAVGDDVFVEEYFVPLGSTADITWRVTVENVNGYEVFDLFLDDAIAPGAIAAFEAAIGGTNGNNSLAAGGSITFVFDGPGTPNTVNIAGVAGIDLWDVPLPRVSDDARVSALGASATIGDFVWNDVNGDGIQDADEKGIAGAKVKITYPDATTIEGMTNSSGKYLFSGLPAGSYKVELILSSIPNPAEGSNKITTATAYTIELADDQTVLTADFGVTAELPVTGISADMLAIIALALLFAGGAALAVTWKREDEKGEGEIAA